ncbi:MAG TPA: diguanylate cyclase [bacterium]|nr:diguanylate cyclase [bacterium]
MEQLLNRVNALNLPQRWILVLLSALAATVAFVTMALHDGNPVPAYLLFYLPLGLSAFLLGPNLAMILSGIVAAVLILNHSVTSAPTWVLLLFLASLVVNLFLLKRWSREQEVERFLYQKNLDLLDLERNDGQIAFDKIQKAYQANQIKIQRYTALNELARNLAVAFKSQDVVILLMETISKTFMAPGGVYTLLLFDSSIGKALHVVRYSVDTDMDVRLNRERLNRSEPFNAWVVAQAKSLFVNDASSDFRFQNFAAESKIRSVVAAPFLAGNEMLGLVRMESGAPGVFRQDDARLLSNFADLGTVALEHVALYKQTIELAITDGLTGLYVQRYYKERVRDEVFRALEHQFPLCVLMIDVDHFKSYNDRYGHLVGDRVLKVVAQILKETIRTVDLAARYGGEEFSVLLLKTPLEGAEKVAERIRQKVQEQEILAAKQVTRVTVSIGVAELNPSLKNVEAFIDFADQALYQAKDAGRNRVRLAKPGQTHGN